MILRLHSFAPPLRQCLFCCSFANIDCVLREGRISAKDAPVVGAKRTIGGMLGANGARKLIFQIKRTEISVLNYTHILFTLFGKL